jgi:hypothetical protein
MSQLGSTFDHQRPADRSVLAEFRQPQLRREWPVKLEYVCRLVWMTKPDMAPPLANQASHLLPAAGVGPNQADLCYSSGHSVWMFSLEFLIKYCDMQPVSNSPSSSMWSMPITFPRGPTNFAKHAAKYPDPDPTSRTCDSLPITSIKWSRAAACM